MRILSGKYKYQKIELAKKLTFPPIVTTIRESIFSILNNHLTWDNVYVCDLFAGSGILGFEALSWGSKFCFFNDLNCRYCKIIDQNCTRLQATNVDVRCSSYEQFLLQLKVKKTKLDLVFIDPPYQKPHLLFASIDLLLKEKLLNNQAIIVVRANQQINHPKHNSLSLLTSKVYGQHYLYFFQFNQNLDSAKHLRIGKSGLVIISGPSGVGKKTIVQALLAQKTLNLAYSVSVTTRTPRLNEKDGIDYHFFSFPAFEKAILRHDFIEYAKYLEHYYGTSQTFVQNLIDQGKNVLFEVELEGALKIKQKIPQAVWIFLFPPSYQELKRRIEKRGTESLSEIKRRLQKAEAEMSQVRENNWADFCLINDSQTKTFQEIVNILQKEWKK